jgi:hypothetical protein
MSPAKFVSFESPPNPARGRGVHAGLSNGMVVVSWEKRLVSKALYLIEEKSWM